MSGKPTDSAATIDRAGSDSDVIAATAAVAAGVILTMPVDTMIAEGADEAHEFSGLIAVGGADQSLATCVVPR